ncbi:hypothetical protein DEA8626_02155 [Defluviimonas aquaemixtae]|uniref:Uncharacterized protein n=1 Tax=Albidovulum aquaemixtae TaxID=1542388 RepID=A0A2R8B7K3_9RHOB|nr:DUF6768 family protein [Defluviimonas aquaemixtae]SPH18615.1 hypothetical protein DEA8626_02155 [Defluviimonas aquaemixtae]
MTKLDELIEEALRDEDRDILEATAEQGWFALGLSQFRGRLGWVTWLVMIVQATMFIIGVWCAIRFFGATEVLAALKWGLSAAVLMLMATALKMSLMPQLQADRVLREVKRLELIVARQRS